MSNTSDTNKDTIEIVKELQKSVRDSQNRTQKWVITMVGTFAIAIMTALFWGGGIDNQVDTNTKNLEILTKIVDKFVTEQQVSNERFVRKQDLENLENKLEKTSANWNRLSFWAESRGYEPLSRTKK